MWEAGHRRAMRKARQMRKLVYLSSLIILPRLSLAGEMGAHTDKMGGWMLSYKFMQMEMKG